MAEILESIKTKYHLQCLEGGKCFSDTGFQLTNPDHPDSLLRAVYSKKRLSVGRDYQGIYKYSDWLPINHVLNGSSAPVTFKSKKLAERLGLENLFITFSGYWPEKNCLMYTGTFKECEAYSVCARLPEDFNDVLVVASAGNTARAFARVCSENNIKLLLVVPDARKQKLWFKDEIAPCVRLVTVGGNSDYYDAIELAGELCKLNGFIAEGGARNVARRDGMGTTVLSAATTMGKIPDYYFQAVGSGTGAIAAWEANLRLIESGDYSSKKMSLQVSQNFPFVPMYDAWKLGTRELLPLDEKTAKEQLSHIYADVLANRKPTYGVTGGMYDALADTNGDVHSVTNKEAKEALQVFMEDEGIDIEPAAAVALASLIKCVQSGRVARKANVMLNITGGGIGRFKEENKVIYLESSKKIDVTRLNMNGTREEIVNLFK